MFYILQCVFIFVCGSYVSEVGTMIPTTFNQLIESIRKRCWKVLRGSLLITINLFLL